VVMRYWQPRAAGVLRQMAADGVEQAVLLSMYPHYTAATTGSSLNDFRRAAAETYPELRFTTIEQWYDWPGYLAALAARIRQGLESYHELMRDQVPILFSAHALPQKYIDRGDPYLKQVMATVEGVMQRLGERPWYVGFQSRSGPVKWMEPETTAVMTRLAAEGQDSLLVVPVSFVSDHIETLHEIDIEYLEFAESKGFRHYVRAPSLNDGADFLDALAELVKQHLEQP